MELLDGASHVLAAVTAVWEFEAYVEETRHQRDCIVRGGEETLVSKIVAVYVEQFYGLVFKCRDRRMVYI